MKHKLSITLLLLAMFLATQFIGLYVVNQYAPKLAISVNETNQTEFTIEKNDLPFGLSIQDDDKPDFFGIIFSFILAFLVIFFLMKYKWKLIMRIWFFLVVAIALSISFYSLLIGRTEQAQIIALSAGFLFAVFKIYKPNVIIHNATELLIYPGIAAIFVEILNPVSIILLLVIISLYDMWAVWRSGIMQKMAKFQMEELNLFGGFLIPTMSKKVREKIDQIRQKYKGKEIPTNLKKRKFKVSLAILGGGDIIFPIITSGVFMRVYGLLPALFIIVGSFAGLTYLFAITKKGKAYPAMPYITAGIFLGLLVWRMFLF